MRENLVDIVQMRKKQANFKSNKEKASYEE